MNSTHQQMTRPTPWLKQPEFQRRLTILDAAFAGNLRLFPTHSNTHIKRHVQTYRQIG